MHPKLEDYQGAPKARRVQRHNSLEAEYPPWRLSETSGSRPLAFLSGKEGNWVTNSGIA